MMFLDSEYIGILKICGVKRITAREFMVIGNDQPDRLTEQGQHGEIACQLIAYEQLPTTMHWFPNALTLIRRDIAEQADL